MALRTAIAIFGLLMAVAGCRRESANASTEARLAEYSQLMLTSQTHDRELQAELALLRAERMLPAMFDGDRGAAAAKNDGGLQHEVTTAFTVSQLRFARERSDAIFQRGVDQWNPLALEQALQFRAAYAEQQQRVRRAMASPHMRLQLPVAAGMASDTRCVDAALVCVRLDCIAAAEALSRGDSDQSLAAIARALHLVEILAAEPHVVARLTAAIGRTDAFSAVQRLAASRVVTPMQLAQLERLISEQLAAWPSDAEAWVSDRAAGLCTYEMIRDGQLLSVLTADELAALREREGIALFAKAVAKNIDADESHYLRAMRRMIDLCEQPYHERTAAIATLNYELDALEHSPQYPIIADRVLLAGVGEGMRQQAADLALARAWSIALAVACGASLPPPEVNPLTGENYDVRITNQHVVVAAIDPLRPQLQVSAPIAGPARLSSRRGAAHDDQPR